MAEGIREDVGDWSAEKRIALALSILRGDLSTEDAARRYGLTAAEVEELKAAFLVAAEKALGSHLSDEDAPVREANPASEDDVGVWVCAMSKESLAPCLFMQSVCADHFPLEASAQWNRVGIPPGPFEEAAL